LFFLFYNNAFQIGCRRREFG